MMILTHRFFFYLLLIDVVAAAPTLFSLASLCKQKSCKDRWRKNKSKPFKSEAYDVFSSLLRTAGQLCSYNFQKKPKALLIFQVIVVEVALGRDRRETVSLEEHLSCSCQCKVKVRDNFKVLFMTRTMLCTAIFYEKKRIFCT